MEKSCKTVFFLSFQRVFCCHNDMNSEGKDKLIKAQLLSLSISVFKTKLNIDLNSKIVIQNRD